MPNPLALHLDKDGYARVQCQPLAYQRWIDPSHHDAYVMAHIAVIEYTELGFAIPEGYQVHHIDKARTNWLPSNLALLTDRQHEIHHAYLDFYTPHELRAMSRANIVSLRSKHKDPRPLLPFKDFLSLTH